MVFAVVTIVFCFLISVFFSKAKISSACGGIIYFLTYLPYVFISIREEAGSVNVSGKEKMAASLFSTSAFGLGARYFAIYEEEGVGMQWSNLGKSPVCSIYFIYTEAFSSLESTRGNVFFVLKTCEYVGAMTLICTVYCSGTQLLLAKLKRVHQSKRYLRTKDSETNNIED